MAVQLMIRHGSPDWWESPDIWVVPGTDPNGPPGTPVAGGPAYLWARVTNQGDVDAFQVQVDFWVANPSLQIRKSTSNHIGTAFADVPAGTSQDVLCLVPWNVTIFNGGHECVVVEASSPADPLSPPPADPDVLDALTYRQIAQRNLSVAAMSGQARREIILQLNAGERADKTIDVEARIGGTVAQSALESLGLRVTREAGADRISGILSEHSLCGSAKPEGHERLQVRVSRGTSSAVFLNVAVRKDLKPEEYGVVRVVARDHGRTIGGLSVVLVDAGQKKGGAQ
jgi:hypothetical protein